MTKEIPSGAPEDQKKETLGDPIEEDIRAIKRSLSSAAKKKDDDALAELAIKRATERTINKAIREVNPDNSTLENHDEDTSPTEKADIISSVRKMIEGIALNQRAIRSGNLNDKEKKNQTAEIRINLQRVEKLQTQLAKEGLIVRNTGRVERISKEPEATRNPEDKSKKILIDEAHRLWPDRVLGTDIELPNGITRKMISDEHLRRAKDPTIEELRLQEAFEMNLSPNELSIDKYLDILKQADKEISPSSTNNSENMNAEGSPKKPTSDSTAQSDAVKPKEPASKPGAEGGNAVEGKEAKQQPAKPEVAPTAPKANPETAPKAVTTNQPQQPPKPTVENNPAAQAEAAPSSDPVEIFINKLKAIKDLGEREVIISEKKNKYKVEIRKAKTDAKGEKKLAKKQHTPFDRKEHIDKARAFEAQAKELKQELRRFNRRLRAEGLVITTYKKWYKPWAKALPRMTKAQYDWILNNMIVKGVNVPSPNQEKILDFSSNHSAALKSIRENLAIDLGTEFVDKLSVAEVVDRYKAKIKEAEEKNKLKQNQASGSTTPPSPSASPSEPSKSPDKPQKPAEPTPSPAPKNPLMPPPSPEPVTARPADEAPQPTGVKTSAAEEASISPPVSNAAPKPETKPSEPIKIDQSSEPVSEPIQEKPKTDKAEKRGKSSIVVTDTKNVAIGLGYPPESTPRQIRDKLIEELNIDKESITMEDGGWVAIRKALSGKNGIKTDDIDALIEAEMRYRKAVKNVGEELGTTSPKPVIAPESTQSSKKSEPTPTPTEAPKPVEASPVLQPSKPKTIDDIKGLTPEAKQYLATAIKDGKLTISVPTSPNPDKAEKRIISIWSSVGNALKELGYNYKESTKGVRWDVVGKTSSLEIDKIKPKSI